MDLRLSTQRCKGFPSLKDGWADTTTPHGRLMLTVLGGPQNLSENSSAPAPARVVANPRQSIFSTTPISVRPIHRTRRENLSASGVHRASALLPTDENREDQRKSAKQHCVACNCAEELMMEHVSPPYRRSQPRPPLRRSRGFHRSIENQVVIEHLSPLLLPAV